MVVTAVKTSLESESAFDLSPSGLFQIAHRAKCNQTLLELNFKEPYPSLIVPGRGWPQQILYFWLLSRGVLKLRGYMKDMYYIAVYIEFRQVKITESLK